MKKNYHKPALYVESFRMVEHIASGCTGAFPQTGNEVPYHIGTSCLYMDEEGNKYFTMDSAVCQDATPVPEGSPLDGLFNCYQGPAGGSATPFHS